MAELEAMEKAFRNAHNAGDKDAAGRLARAIKAKRAQGAPSPAAAPTEAAPVEVESGPVWTNMEAKARHDATIVKQEQDKELLSRGAAWEVTRTIGQNALAMIGAGLEGIRQHGLAMEEGASFREAATTSGAATEEFMSEWSYTPENAEAREALVGIAELFSPVTEKVDATKNALGEAGMEYGAKVGLGPELATVGYILPDLAMELAGIKGVGGIIRRSDVDKMDAPIEEGPLGLEGSAGLVAKQRRDELAEAADVNPEVVAAAEIIDVEATPGMMSGNEGLKQIERAVKREAEDSVVAAKEEVLVTRLTEEAEDLIVRSGGEVDVSGLDDIVLSQYSKMRDRLSAESDALFKTVGENINPRVRLKPIGTRNLINDTLKDLGGDADLLPEPMKLAMKILNRTDAKGRVQSPTYAAMDQLRRKIGHGFQGKGEFKDAAHSELSVLYHSLSKDQLNAASIFGQGERLAKAQKLVAQRKELETNAVSLFGKDLDKGFGAQLTSATGALTKGDTSKFRKLMKALPADMRTKAASTALNRVFGLNVRGSGKIGRAFADTYAQLKRNPVALNEIKRHLPPSDWRRFEAIGTLTEAMESVRTSGGPSAARMVELLERGVIHQKLINTAASAATILGWKGFGHWGAAAADKIGRSAKSQVKAEARADRFLASPALRKALIRASRGDSEGANLIIKKSLAFRGWLGDVAKASPEAAAQIETLGFMQFLLSEPEQAAQTGEQN